VTKQQRIEALEELLRWAVENGISIQRRDTKNGRVGYLIGQTCGCCSVGEEPPEPHAALFWDTVNAVL
jgi:hypothetical protein